MEVGEDARETVRGVGLGVDVRVGDMVGVSWASKFGHTKICSTERCGGSRPQ